MMLEVAVRSVADAKAASAGGADRVEVVGEVRYGEMSPEPTVVAEICRETDLRVRVRLRLREEYTTDGGELVRLRALAHEYTRAGAEGMVLGFLTPYEEIDAELCGAVAGDAPWPWTFHDAVDHAFDSDKAWRVLRQLPRCDQVLTAGSPRGVEAGLDEILTRAREADPSLLLVGGALEADHVPWLVRAGVRNFRLDVQVRPARSWDEPVDADFVRVWRRLLDDAESRFG